VTERKNQKTLNISKAQKWYVNEKLPNPGSETVLMLMIGLARN